LHFDYKVTLLPKITVGKMNAIEKKMVVILKRLKEEFGTTAVKVNLEAEGIRMTEILRTKEIAMSADVGLTVKIGGCEAISDLRLSQIVGVNTIVAPMIESKFALEKYLAMIETEYGPNELEDLKILINIETVDGYEKFDNMLTSSKIGTLHGIVLGRTDLAVALNQRDVDGPEMLSLAKDLFFKAKSKSLLCIVGGGMSVKSLPFLSVLKDLLDGFETRKVVFGNYGKAKAKIDKGIPLALQFEHRWYELKQQYYGKIYNEDISRMQR
jgi:4-hydroxy-2-oxoheptanedioate aldolase